MFDKLTAEELINFKAKMDSATHDVWAHGISLGDWVPMSYSDLHLELLSLRTDAEKAHIALVFVD